MIAELIAFFAGIFLTLTGAYISYLFQKHYEKKKVKEKIRFEVYMNLLDLSTYYFWVTTAEVHNEKVDPKNNKLIRDITFKTSDRLRQFEEIEYLDEILDVLFSEKFETAVERANKLDELIEKLHKLISPKFIEKIKQIGEENRQIMLSKSMTELNAPGSAKF